MKRLASFISGSLLVGTIFAGDANLTVNYEFVDNSPAESENYSNEGTEEAAVYDYDASYYEYHVSPTNELISRPKKFYGITPNAFLTIEYVYSPNYKVLNIPIGFQITDKLYLKIRVPYIDRRIKVNGKWYKARGIGDTLVGFDYSEIRNDYFSTTTSIATTFPTGDNEKTDDGVLVPLGKDAFNIQLVQNFMFYKAGFLFSGAVGIKHYLTNNVFKYQGQKYEEEVGDKYFFHIGAIRDFGKILRASAKLVYYQTEESKLKRTGAQKIDLNNDLKAADIVVNIIPLKLNYKNITVRFTAILPVYTDTDVSDSKDRKYSLALGLTSAF
jgi:hypothetical protein